MRSLRLPNLLLAALTAFAILVGAILLVAIDRHRDFQVDEVEHLHAAYQMRAGHLLYRDFWQGHPPLLYCLIAPLTNVADPIGSFLRARLLSLAIVAGIVALCAFCAFRLSNGWGAALAAAMALLHTTLIERGIEVRPDGALALLVLAALAVELTNADRLRRSSIEALLLGTGLVLTQKGVLPLAAFGLVWLYFAWRSRRPRVVLQPALLACVPLAAALAVMALLGNLQPFLHFVVFDAASAAAHAQTRGTFSPVMFLLREGVRNAAFVVIAIAGLIALFRRSDERARVAAFIAVAAVASLWANPFPWPYVHLSFVPLLVVVAAAFVARLRAAAGIAALLLIAVTAVPRLVVKSVPATQLQFAVLREVDRVTSPRDAVFDLAGLYFRPDAYPVYAMSGDMLLSYAYGGFPPMIPALRRNAVACVIYNYRTAVLPADVKQFIGAHFVHYWTNLFLPGADLSNKSGVMTFEVLAPRAFRYDGSGAIAIDGRPFTRGILAAGAHRVEVIRAASPSRLIAATPPPIPAADPPQTLFTQFD